MTENTKIEWAHHTFNPWIGCTKVGPGCDHCYAEAMDHRFGGGHWGPGAPRKRTSESNWKQPLRWNRRAEKEGVRYRVFCASLADVFDNEIDPQWRHDLFALIKDTPHLDWLLLTKRIGQATKLVDPGVFEDPPNIWLGATIVNQEEADRDIPKLLRVPARVRFLSMEPLLGAVDLGEWLSRSAEPGQDHQFSDRLGFRGRLHWIIAGGESGPNARPMHPDWARSLRDQCGSAGVPFFFKQWGEWVSEMHPAADPTKQGTSDEFVEYIYDDEGRASDYRGEYMCHVGKKKAGRLLDGRTWDEVPA